MGIKMPILSANRIGGCLQGHLKIKHLCSGASTLEWVLSFVFLYYHVPAKKTRVYMKFSLTEVTGFLSKLSVDKKKGVLYNKKHYR